jgi:GH24 family phage-related lysozyme (muramidase)
MNEQRILTPRGTALIHYFEQLVLFVYDDKTYPPKPWNWNGGNRGTRPTVGWGHLLTAAERATRMWAAGITREQADALFARDTGWAVKLVRQTLTVQATANQFDALVSATFNLGHPPKDIVVALNAGTTDAATITRLFLQYNHSDGAVNPGLTLRRAREAALFLKPDPAPDGPSDDEVMASVYAMAQGMVGAVLTDHPAAD